MNKDRSITLQGIFWFWVPLAAMWLIMSAQQPSVTAVVSRLPDATRNLAAFGLTFSLALIIESPVIMLLSAGTALASHRQSYARLLTFTHILVAVLTALHLVLALTPLFPYILREWIGAPEATVEPSRNAFLLMVPWTAMIAYRRLSEGVMIRYGHPKRVTWVIIARLTVTILVLVVGLSVGRWAGASVGAAALSVGVTVGAVTAWLLARRVVRDEMPGMQGNMRKLGWKRLIHFYTPLALSTLLTMIAQPVLAFGLSRAAHPLESLAVWPVVMALLFIGRSLGVAYQEVVVALLETEGAYAPLRRFALMLAASGTTLFALLAFTPGAALWYRHLVGLEPELVGMAMVPTAIVALVPGLGALIAWQRAVLIHDEHTAPITAAVALNVATLALVMGLVFVLRNIPGAVIAAGALTASLIVESLYLGWQLRPATRLRTLEAGVGD